ncbi:MAG: EF-hand domain-containing protein, partial [Planctomycetota bacterium]
LGQAKETPSTTTTLPATSRAEDARRTLDALPGSGSGWAKKDLDPETWKFFEKLDADGNEVIDANEQKRFTDAMESQAIAKTVNDADATNVPSALLSLKRRLRRLDKNRNGFGRTDVTEDAWLWLFRNYDKNTNDKLDASEELAFLTEFQLVATEHLQGKALIEALRPLFRKRDKNGNGVGADEVDAPSWRVLATYDTEPRNGRIDRNAEETRFLQDYQAKLSELLKLLVEAGDQPATPPANKKAAHLRATMKQFDTKGDGLDTTDVAADTWSMLFARYDTNKDGRLDAAESDKLVQEWEKWTEEPVAEPDAKVAVKRRVLTVRKIATR